jgi:hypothetical protein
MAHGLWWCPHCIDQGPTPTSAFVKVHGCPYPAFSRHTIYFGSMGQVNVDLNVQRRKLFEKMHILLMHRNMYIINIKYNVCGCSQGNKLHKSLKIEPSPAIKNSFEMHSRFHFHSIAMFLRTNSHLRALKQRITEREDLE